LTTQLKRLGEKLQQFWHDEEGMSTLEILLIIAVIVIIAIAFRKWIIAWVNGLFKSVDTEISTQNNSGNVVLPSSSP